MKKIISAALAAAVTLSVSAVAFAAQDPADTENSTIRVVSKESVALKDGDGIEAVLAAMDLGDVAVEAVSQVEFDSDTAYALMVGDTAITPAAAASDTVEVARAEEDRAAGYASVAGADVAKFTIDTAADIVFKTVTVTYDSAVAKPEKPDNQPTGIALAIAPAALAAAFVGVAAVVSKKKKG